MTREPPDENFLQNRPAYWLALEIGNYRAAARLAIAALRASGEEPWRWRLRGALTRRHRRKRR